MYAVLGYMGYRVCRESPFRAAPKGWSDYIGDTFGQLLWHTF